MAKIALSEGGFSLLPEGPQVLKIVDVKYKEEFGKMEVIMENVNGTKHTERFFFLKQDGSSNDGAISAFSYLARCALNDSSLTEIDHKDIIGHYFKTIVEHEEVESNKKPGTYVKFARLGDKEPADGFEKTVAATKPSPAASEAPKKGSKVDLSKLLG